jgi:large subunit ribosomal protein L13
MNQTTLTKQEAVTHRWYQASAKGVVLGHLAVRVANALMGRVRPDWTPHTDGGDFVVVTDVESLVVTGNKAEKKIYKFHSGYMGGLTELSFEDLHAKKPDQVFMLAVRRMLPKTNQARDQLKRLKIYKGSAHPHKAQNPAALP